MIFPREIELPEDDDGYLDLQCPICLHVSYSEEEFYAHECREQEEY